MTKLTMRFNGFAVDQTKSFLELASGRPLQPLDEYLAMAEHARPKLSTFPLDRPFEKQDATTSLSEVGLRLVLDFDSEAPEIIGTCTIVSGFLAMTAKHVLTPYPGPTPRHTLQAAPEPRSIGCHGQRDSAEQLDSLGDRIDQLGLLSEVLVEEQVQLVESRAGDLPVVLLVEVAQRHGVSDQLIKILDAFLAHVLRQGDWHADGVPVRLEFWRMLIDKGLGCLQKGIGVWGSHMRYSSEQASQPLDRRLGVTERRVPPYG